MELLHKFYLLIIVADVLDCTETRFSV